MYKKIILTNIIFFVIGCNTHDIKYESIEKNDSFRNSVQTGEFALLKDGHTYYEYKNLDHDEIMVLIHGFSVPSYIWDETYYEAIDRGFGVIRLDLYGRGYSSNPDVIYNDELYANQVVGLLDYLQVSQKVNFAGLSNGGRVISKIAIKYPERVKRLIYVAPGGFHGDKSLPDTTPVSDEDIKTFIATNYPTIAKGQLQDFKYPRRFKGWDKKYEELLKYKGFARALISTSRNNFVLDDINSQIGQSEIPQFAIWGDSDTVLPLNEVRNKLSELMPNLKLFVIQDSGHLPHKEQFVNFHSILFNKIFTLPKRAISSKEGEMMFANGKSIFLDVRTNAEHDQRSIPNSLLIPLDELAYRLDEIEKYKNNNIVVYCRVGNRSGVATDLLINNGYRAMNLLGGITDWNGPILTN